MTMLWTESGVSTPSPRATSELQKAHRIFDSHGAGETYVSAPADVLMSHPAEARP